MTNFITGNMLPIALAATSLPGMGFYSVKTLLTQPVRTALRSILYLCAIAFILLLCRNAYYSWYRILDEETSLTNAACLKAKGCKGMDEPNKNDPRYSTPCEEDKRVCARNPSDRALEKITDILPSWSTVTETLQEKLLLLCFIGTIVQLIFACLMPHIKAKKRDREHSKVLVYRRDLQKQRETAAAS